MSTERRTHLWALAFVLALPAASRAQIGGEGLPDLSGISGSISKAAIPAKNPGKAYSSGLHVPSVSPGAAAKEIGKQLREKVESSSGTRQPALQQLEDNMPAMLSKLEDQLGKIGFAKRDMGVAVGYFFVMNYETATGKTVPTDASEIAGRTVAAAVAKTWGDKFNTFSPGTKESIYETLLVTPTLLNAFATQFEKAGSSDDAKGMRAAAASNFQKLFGVAPSAVTIDSGGRISGLAKEPDRKVAAVKTGKGASNRPPEPVLKAGGLTAASTNGAKIFVRYRSTYGLSGMEVRIDQLVMFPDGTAFDDVPDKPLPSFDIATLRKYSRADEVGRWKATGNKLTLTFGGKTETFSKHASGGWAEPGHKSGSFDVYFPAKFATKAQIVGRWKNENLVTMGSAGGGTAMVAAGSNNDLSFQPNGTFVKAGKSFASATTANMGDAFKSGGDVTTTSGGKSGSNGQWRLDGPLLTTVEKGLRAVQVAIILPNWGRANEPPTLLIQGDRWDRPNKS